MQLPPAALLLLALGPQQHPVPVDVILQPQPRLPRNIEVAAVLAQHPSVLIPQADGPIVISTRQRRTGHGAQPLIVGRIDVVLGPRLRDFLHRHVERIVDIAAESVGGHVARGVVAFGVEPVGR